MRSIAFDAATGRLGAALDALGDYRPASLAELAQKARILTDAPMYSVHEGVPLATVRGLLDDMERLAALPSVG